MLGPWYQGAPLPGPGEVGGGGGPPGGDDLHWHGVVQGEARGGLAWGAGCRVGQWVQGTRQYLAGDGKCCKV